VYGPSVSGVSADHARCCYRLAESAAGSARLRRPPGTAAGGFL